MADTANMQSAGRVIPIHRGDYSNLTSYSAMDEVLYNGSSFIAKQTTIGNPPPNSGTSNDYWQMTSKGEYGNDISGKVVTFTESTTRDNINTGESTGTLFGKIKKWYSSLKSVAFSGSYDDLSNRPTIPPAVSVKGNNESTYRTGNVNLTPDNIGAVPWYNSTNVAASTDWNTIVNSGGYFVQAGTMNADKNAPVGVYGYGMLYVFTCSNNTIIHLYIPDTSVDNPNTARKIAYRIRYNNTSSWKAWQIINTVAQNDVAYVNKSGTTNFKLGVENGLLYYEEV